MKQRDVIITKIADALLLGTLALFLSGCGSEPSIQVDPQAKAFYDRFLFEAEDHGFDLKDANIEIVFIEQGREPGSNLPVKALCTAGSVPKVSITQHSWDQLSDTYREIAVYHELGHCLLARQHKNELNDDGQPVSIMNAILEQMRESYYIAYRQDYIRELFKNAGISKNKN
jgi:hypothetical protein